MTIQWAHRIIIQRICFVELNLLVLSPSFVESHFNVNKIILCSSVFAAPVSVMNQIIGSVYASTWL